MLKLLDIYIIFDISIFCLLLKKVNRNEYLNKRNWILILLKNFVTTKVK